MCKKLSALLFGLCFLWLAACASGEKLNNSSSEQGNAGHFWADMTQHLQEGGSAPDIDKEEASSEVSSQEPAVYNKQFWEDAFHPPVHLQSLAYFLPAAEYAKQLIIVSVSGTEAVVSMHEKDENGLWKEIHTAEGYVGSDGIGEAKEGVPRTPQGTYSLTSAFGVRDNPGTVLPYTKVDSSHYWVDDSYSRYYNQLVSIWDVEKDWNSAEYLAGETLAYAYSIVIDYNTECVPGKGSAFFLHCSQGVPTFGCVAVPEESMVFFLQNISEDAYIVIEHKENLDVLLE